jgi:hypothetical protein
MAQTLSYFTRPGCQLCGDALPLVMGVARKYGFLLQEINIDPSDELTMTYGLRIPVLATADRTVLAEGIIEERPLRKALRKAARAAGQQSQNR